MRKTIQLINIFLLVSVIFLSSCGGLTKREGDYESRFNSTLENTWGCIELTLNVIALEYLFNVDESPISDDSLDKNSNDILLFDKYYHRKSQFESLIIEIDSVYFEFCAEGQAVGNGKIDSIFLSVGNLLNGSGEDIISGNLNMHFESPLLRDGTAELSINSDSVLSGSSYYGLSFKEEDRDTIAFTASAFWKQIASNSISADSAIMNIYCSINYIEKEGDINRIKIDSLLLNFKNDDKFWVLESFDKDLVALLDNLDN
jgi:hypothetical protein